MDSQPNKSWADCTKKVSSTYASSSLSIPTTSTTMRRYVTYNNASQKDKLTKDSAFDVRYEPIIWEKMTAVMDSFHRQGSFTNVNAADIIVLYQQLIQFNHLFYERDLIPSEDWYDHKKAIKK